jgi:hypothetical protein
MNRAMRAPIKLVTLCLLALAYSCSKPAPPKDMLDELMQKEHTDRLSIGWVDGQKLEVIVFGSKPDLRQFTISAQDANKLKEEYSRRNRPAEISEGTDAQLSPDDKWMTYRTRDNKFVLADSNRRVDRALFDGSGVLTPLYWSPQSEYLMYVEKAGAWETGFCARNLADGRDIMVYRVHDGQKGRVYQVCDGYPYARFGWLRTPINLPLSR